jgi:hypothetical protein
MLLSECDVLPRELIAGSETNHELSLLRGD